MILVAESLIKRHAGQQNRWTVSFDSTPQCRHSRSDSTKPGLTCGNWRCDGIGADRGCRHNRPNTRPTPPQPTPAEDAVTSSEDTAREPATATGTLLANTNSGPRPVAGTPTEGALIGMLQHATPQSRKESRNEAGHVSTPGQSPWCLQAPATDPWRHKTGLN